MPISDPKTGPKWWPEKGRIERLTEKKVGYFDSVNLNFEERSAMTYFQSKYEVIRMNNHDRTSTGSGPSASEEPPEAGTAITV